MNRPRRMLPGWFIVALLMSLTSLAYSFEVGDTVRVRDGMGYRTGRIVGTLGNRYRVQYGDGHLPTEEFLDESKFVSDEEVEQERRDENVAKFYQSLGRALLPAFIVGAVFAWWWKTRRKHPLPPTDPNIRG